MPYELKEYKRTSEQTAPEELKKIHPLGKAPVITDGDVTLAESGAIVGESHVVSLVASDNQAVKNIL